MLIGCNEKGREAVKEEMNIHTHTHTTSYYDFYDSQVSKLLSLYQELSSTSIHLAPYDLVEPVIVGQLDSLITWHGSTRMHKLLGMWSRSYGIPVVSRRTEKTGTWA